MRSCGRSATVNDPSGGSVIEQHLYSEVAEQVVSVQESCLEVACNVVDSNADLSTVTDGYEGEDFVGSARCIDEGSCDALGLASECENADLLSLEKPAEDDCLNCLGVSYGGIEVPCASSGPEGNFQGEENFDLRSRPLTTDDSPRHCAQQDGQKDDKSHVSPAAGDESVVGGKIDDTCLLGDVFNHVLDFRDSEMSLELESVADLLVDCNQQNEQQEMMRNADSLFNVVEKCDNLIGTEADACRHISPTVDMEVPSGALYADTEVDSTSDPKDGEVQNSTCEEKVKSFVDEEIIVINSCVKMSSSPGCQGTVESSSVDSPCEPALLDPGCEMKNDVLQIEDAFCKLKDCSSEETSNSTFRKPFSPESGLPWVASIANCSSKDVSDLHCKGDDVSTPTATNNAVDDPGKMVNDGKEALNVDCITESIPLLSQRSSRRSKVGRKTQTKKASRRGKNKTKVTCPNGDYMKLYSEAARKKRSCFSKPARSSIWGLIGNIEHFFEHDSEHAVREAVCQEFGKARSKRQSGKAVKNNASTGSLSSVKKCPVSTTRVRLKIKFGKEPDLSCSNVLTPESVDGLASASYLESGSASQKIASNLEDKMLKVVTLGNTESFNNNVDKDDLVRNGQVANSPIEGHTEITEKADGDVEEHCLAAPPEKVIEALIEPINNKGMDPGTSPDSEVINSIPEVHVAERHEEDLHDAVLGSSKELNSKVDATVSKRGKKKDKLISSGICITEDESQGPPRNRRGKQSKNRRGKKNCTGAISSLDLSTPTQINKSVSSKQLCPESLSLSGETELGRTAEALKVKNDMDINTSCKPSVDNGFSESQVSENMLSSARPLGRKLPKSLRPSKVSRTKFKASDSADRKKTTCTRKEKQKKPIVKSEVKRKGASLKITCEMEDRPHAGSFLCPKLTASCVAFFFFSFWVNLRLTLGPS